MILYFFCIVFILGAAIGSFINCLVWRLYHGESLMSRSHCPNCLEKISWYDNIPVLSYIILNAKCRHCRKPISSQYYWLEVVSGLLFVLVLVLNLQGKPANLEQIIWAVNFDWHWFLTLIRDWVLVSTLMAIFLGDLKWFVVFDVVCLTGAGAMIILNLALGMPWWSIALGALVGAGIFIIQSLASKGAWVGGGDIYIGFLMGVAVGWPNILVALFGGYILGAIWGLILVARGKKKLDWKRIFKKGDPSDVEIAEAGLPFGTVLALGTFIALYWGQNIISWYLGRIL
ncbi:hypothetical protein COT94_01895 [Candidatus Falkowbacteria bacterium CG10_big_fil_rev_8_21_14_0_10_37_14]|uniref:Prepilin peptidase n=1 Tax=Candidatus Falkowbacteria bacterium CG10_big_fil_rev_8_21_14_0_10_37_14 TaxID=1974561 RepID=A0A2M6WTT2_9BACT|nr:prepilin peptidase [Candidatus Falkowbacteria bacterium]PIT96199.1 MAG: hypothetical protein COT94_01895 [Candidatus Falkowbacteria bacterium CG10_big_fil_rev_8_21_14_0_10_37_14]